MRRRTVVFLLAALCAAPLSAGAQDKWPSKPLKIVVAQGAGTVLDITARQIGDALAKSIGQAVIIENRPGAGNTLGADFVAKSAPDGYTILLASQAELTIAPSFYKGLPYDPARDFEPITQVNAGSSVLVVNPSLEARTVPELIALAKAKPGQIMAGSFGNGTLTHLMLLQFTRLAGVDIAHVPYKSGASALNDVVAGHVNMLFDWAATSRPFIASGKLRPLMIAGPQRNPAFPDVPSAAEAGFPDMSFRAWGAFVAPTGTPKEVIRRLHDEIVKIIRTPEMLQAFAGRGAEVIGSSPEELAAIMKRDRAKYAEFIRGTGARPD